MQGLQKGMKQSHIYVNNCLSACAITKYSLKIVGERVTATQVIQNSKNRKEEQAPWNTQNHKSSAWELGFHPVMYFPISSHGGILAS